MSSDRRLAAISARRAAPSRIAGHAGIDFTEAEADSLPFHRTNLFGMAI
jgi:hypothetical protein